MLKETWKPMRSLEKTMQISTLGRLQHVRNGKVRGKPFISKQCPRGYSHIKPRVAGNKRLCIRVHRAVWETFVGDIPHGMSIDHINRNRSDNRLENLRPATSKQQRANMKTSATRRDARPITVWRLSDPENVMEFPHAAAAAKELGAITRALRSVANGIVRRTGEFGACWRDNAEFFEGEVFRCATLRGKDVHVSNHGRLLDKTKAFAVYPIATPGNDYPTAGSKSVFMHLAVAKAWPELIGGEPGEGKTIDHIDRNKNNNNPSNLRWATAKEQAANKSRRSSGRHESSPE